MEMEQLSAGRGALTAVRTGKGSDLVVLHSLLADRHCEGVAAGRNSSGEVLRDRLDPAGRVFEPLFAEADLAPEPEAEEADAGEGEEVGETKDGGAAS